MQHSDQVHNTELLYIHGFASSGMATKAQLLQRVFTTYHIHSPTLSPHPEHAIRQLDAIVQQSRERSVKLVMIGSSLGGFYADYYNRMSGIPCLLINPLVDADDMRVFIGEHVNFSTGETFDFTMEDFQTLKRLKDQKRATLATHVRAYVLIATDDEVLDATKSIHYFQESHRRVKTYPHGGHRFQNEEHITIALMELLQEIDV